HRGRMEDRGARPDRVTPYEGGPSGNRTNRRTRSAGVADWNKGTIDEFHARGGKGVGHFGDKLLLLTTRGAKSGEVRTTPLVYHRDGDRYVIAASTGGAPSHPSWYHNLVKHREAEVEVGREKFKVRATTIAKGPERDGPY